MFFDTYKLDMLNYSNLSLYGDTLGVVLDMVFVLIVKFSKEDRINSSNNEIAF